MAKIINIGKDRISHERCDECQCELFYFDLVPDGNLFVIEMTCSVCGAVYHINLETEVELDP